MGKTEIYSDFDILFGRNRMTNDIIKQTDEDAIKQSLKSLILTSYYDRKWHPEIGSHFRSYLFNLSDSYILLLAKQELYNLFTKYEPRIRINLLGIKQNERNPALIQIRLEYTILNLMKEDTFVYSINRLR